MSSQTKILIGAVAALLASWLYIGALGNGARFVDALEAQAKTVVAASEIQDVQVRLQRHPLKRLAILSGNADEFQRNGLGSLKGLTQRVEEVPGVAHVQWSDRPASGFVLPLVAESLVAALISYLLGLGLGWLFWGRERDDAA